MRMQVRLVVAALLAVGGVAPAARAADAVGIAGTYRLVKRILPDGTVLLPPAVVGFETYGKGYRNFFVKWSQPDGTPVSLSVLSRYELTPTRYCEHPVAWVQNNLGKPGISYQWPVEKEQCSDVKAEGGKLTFALKGEPVVATFDAHALTATAAGMFTDVWERLK
jgi:hypothetical protein